MENLCGICGGPHATGACTESKTKTLELIHFEDPRYGEFNDFSNFLGQRVDKGGDDNSKKYNKVVLEKHGLDTVSPESINPHFYEATKRFVIADWEYIGKANDKLLALHTVKNFHTEEAINEGPPVEPWGIDKFTPSPEEIGSLAALPLVYQTKFERLAQILESGKVLSDRAYYQALTTQGKQPNAATLEEFLTHTHGDDRRAGLDDYVFTFFGRPHSQLNYGNIEILFKPDQFHEDQRSFATQNDFLDIVDREGGSEDAYRDEILQGSYFIRAAARKLKRAINGRTDIARSFLAGDTDIKHQYGGTTFSTWEVKVPQLTVDDIDSIVFHSEEDRERFRGQYGDRFRTILKPGTTAVKTGEGFDPEKIYQLSDREKRKQKFIQEELERGKEEREVVVPETEQRTCYVEISFAKEYITQEADIYKLNPGKIFADLATAQSELQTKKQMKRRSAFYTAGEEDEIKMTLVKLTTVQKEFEEYEDTKDRLSRFPARLQHYRIDEVVEL